MYRFEFQKAISRIAASLPKKCEIDFHLWIKFDRRKLFKGFLMRKMQCQEGKFL
jgi:hypothetical protein